MKRLVAALLALVAISAPALAFTGPAPAHPSAGNCYFSDNGDGTYAIYCF
jgi:hypothetical protein